MSYDLLKDDSAFEEEVDFTNNDKDQENDSELTGETIKENNLESDANNEILDISQSMEALMVENPDNHETLYNDEDQYGKKKCRFININQISY